MNPVDEPTSIRGGRIASTGFGLTGGDTQGCGYVMAGLLPVVRCVGSLVGLPHQVFLCDLDHVEVSSGLRFRGLLEGSNNIFLAWFKYLCSFLYCRRPRALPWPGGATRGGSGACALPRWKSPHGLAGSAAPGATDQPCLPCQPCCHPCCHQLSQPLPHRCQPAMGRLAAWGAPGALVWQRARLREAHQSPDNCSRDGHSGHSKEQAAHSMRDHRCHDSHNGIYNKESVTTAAVPVARAIP